MLHFYLHKIVCPLYVGHYEDVQMEAGALKSNLRSIITVSISDFLIEVFAVITDVLFGKGCWY